MERRVLIALLLCFVVLYVWQAVFVKPAPKSAASGAPASTQQSSVPPSAVPVSPAPTSAGEATEKPSGAVVVTGESNERDVRVETRDVIAVFTNRGGRLKSWRLRHYLDQTRAPLELIPERLPMQPLPFSLRVPDDGTTTELNESIYAVVGAPALESAASSAVQLTFEYKNAAGLHSRKEFHLEPTSYVVQFRAVVSQGDRQLNPIVQWGPAVADQPTDTSRTQKPQGMLFADTKVLRLAPKDLAKQASYSGEFPLAGVDDQYFLAAALTTGSATVRYQPISIPSATPKQPPRDLVSFAIDPMTAGTPMRFFVGPKDFDVLAGIDRNLVRAINFGWFSVLVVPLLRSLKWINGFAGNYGWSIIILTVVINAIMFPLRHKSVVSMRKMQEIQPEAKAIQDRYAKLKTTDPARQKMNQELMALYRERGVNPASGCVPMLLTMPVLLAFYALLSTAIELRGAPFFGWIHDLSLHDPLYVTPILMGISMFWQQRISPATGADPAQQRMMMLMPVVFTFMFLWVPAGVAIYYGVSNLWGIGQQYLTNYLIGPPNIRTVRPPAQRQLKRAGSGRSEAASRET
jgi:YidC/Oxa1 family membrane protein insertase